MHFTGVMDGIEMMKSVTETEDIQIRLACLNEASKLIDNVHRVHVWSDVQRWAEQYYKWVMSNETKGN